MNIGDTQVLTSVNPTNSMETVPERFSEKHKSGSGRNLSDHVKKKKKRHNRRKSADPEEHTGVHEPISQKPVVS